MIKEKTRAQYQWQEYPARLKQRRGWDISGAVKDQAHFDVTSLSGRFSTEAKKLVSNQRAAHSLKAFSQVSAVHPHQGLKGWKQDSFMPIVPKPHPRLRYVLREATPAKQRPAKQRPAKQRPAEQAEASHAEEVVIAFEGHIDQVAEGIATLRLIDREGRRSTAAYAAADLERDSISAQAGTAFRCQVVRDRNGLRVSFQPVPRRTVSEAKRKQLEDEMIAAYSTLENDY